MKNKIVGTLIIIIAALIGFIIFSFNRAMTRIVNTSCSHGDTCPMWGTIEFQTYISAGIMVLVVAIGIYLIFFGKEEKTITKIKRIKSEKKSFNKDNYKNIMNTLNEDEKLIFGKILDAQGTVFQSELVEKTDFNKAKVTRILDRLEGRGIVERRRRGMTNVVILK